MTAASDFFCCQHFLLMKFSDAFLIRSDNGWQGGIKYPYKQLLCLTLNLYKLCS